MRLLVLHARAARARALAVAKAEALALLRPFGATESAGGPLAAERGVFWIAVGDDHDLQDVAARAGRLGYCDALYAVEAGPARTGRERAVTWRSRPHHLALLYAEDAAAVRELAPDRRYFALETGGRVRHVRGYRGSGDALARRGLAVADARMLANLVAVDGEWLLDPFAGVGGIAIAARAAGTRVATCDLDPALRHGLAEIADVHCVADAVALPFAADTFSGIATEPPFDGSAAETVERGIADAVRVLRTGARLAVLCARAQSDGVRRAARGLRCELDSPVDRKGLAVDVLCWTKPATTDAS